ncbi:hypothetical protein NIES23_61010 (plasmid) [Trichormus variabilis NIES-23]|uniref:Uncharacterized protein n=1 Tax=Trichormus variabilis NIES-23 TaxID=1973479 RepID=A0A1Z4KWM5_ANAVA|nr:hypothetical protein NIES23_61010 [Trichormus variabilis NIES-23]
MTHVIYTHQQLQHKSIADLKQIYSDIGCTVELGNRYSKNAWIAAIAQHQAQRIHRIAPAALDEQAQAQEELENFIAQQAEEIAPESLTVREISFYEQEYYAGERLIATITYDGEDFVTQRWVVMVNRQEIHRHYAPEGCDRFIHWKYLDGKLPVQEQSVRETSTGNEVMAEIATECEKRGLELLDDGVYKDNYKLGEVELRQGILWAIRAESRERVMCDRGVDAVWWLSTANASSAEEYLQYHPLEQLKNYHWEQLFIGAELVAV